MRSLHRLQAASSAGLLLGVLTVNTRAVAGADLNLSGLGQYGSEEQVTSITQFSDVQPTDWAYQALSNLIERYGCVAGYPNGTFRGGRAMTRWEAAALMNACLDRVTEVTDELRRLMKEFEQELAVLKGRVDGLEAKVGELEATQFSTTTKLKGIATFVLGANSYSGSSQNVLATFTGYNQENLRATQGAATFNYDVRLNFDTSFTGKDLLRTTLRSGNFGNTAYGNGVLPNNSLEVAFQESEASGNIVAINRLFYQFPMGDKLTVTFGGRVRQDDMLAMWPSAYPADTVLDVFTYAGSPGAYSLNLGAGAGVFYQDNGFNFSINYVAQDGQNGNPNVGGIGTSGSSETFTAQLGYAGDNAGIAVAYTYANGFATPAGTPLASFGNSNGLSTLGEGVVINTVGISAYWQPFQAGWLPSISTGWGLSGYTGITDWAGYLDLNLSGARAQSWYVGLQWEDAFIKGNALGMAVGQTPFITTLPTSARNNAAFGTGANPNDGNYAWEWWYKFQVTDNISVTPALYYLSQAAGQEGKGTGFTAPQNLNNFGGLIKTTFKF